MKRRNVSGFTLVELLVVIGIIALLIGILMPALGKARESANTLKCAANLRSCGQGIALYIANNRGRIPAAVVFSGMKLAGGQQYGPGGLQTAADIWSRGYVSWSSQVFTQSYDVNDPAFATNGGWQIFTCPSLEKGGVAPCNTFPENQDAPCVNETAGALDAQAPRLAYMLNEALAPRGRFGLGVPGNAIKSPYHYVSAGKVKNSAGTILGTENWGLQQLMLTKNQLTSAQTASNSRRPVSGVNAIASAGPAGLGSASAENLYTAQFPENFVGRNHGPKKLATVAGGTVSGWDMRKTNFLYLDGHVETKNVVDTVYPVSEWGEKFYDLVR